MATRLGLARDYEEGHPGALHRKGHFEGKRKMRFVRLILRVIIGAVIGLATAFVLTPAIAAVGGPEGGDGGAVAILVIVALSGLIAALAPGMRRAFGRSFLLLGLAFIALPISGFMLASRTAHEVSVNAQGADQAATLIGAGLAGAAITGLGTVVGLVFGSIFTILALVLLLGGRREVIIVENRTTR